MRPQLSRRMDGGFAGAGANGRRSEVLGRGNQLGPRLIGPGHQRAAKPYSPVPPAPGIWTENAVLDPHTRELYARWEEGGETVCRIACGVIAGHRHPETTDRQLAGLHW